MLLECQACKTIRDEKYYNSLMRPCFNCGSSEFKSFTLPPNKPKAAKPLLVQSKKSKKRKVKKKFQRPDYKDYIDSDAWRHKRKAAFAYYGRICNRCKSVKNLRVHHKNYVRLGREKMRDLEILCKDCHGIEHEDKYLPEDDLSVEYRNIVT